MRLLHQRSSTAVARWLTAAGFRVEEPADLVALEDVALLVIADGLSDELDRARLAGVPTVMCEQSLSLSTGLEKSHEALTRIALPLQRSVLLAAVGQVLKLSAPVPAGGVKKQAWTEARVLVVDDDAVNRTIAQAMLGRLGCKPLVLSGGQQALDALAREPFDLVLMDCEMPDLDGLTVTREVRRREREHQSPRLAVVALTGHATEVQRELCLAAEMDEMLTKPISLGALTACLERWAPAPPAESPTWSSAHVRATG